MSDKVWFIKNMTHEGAGLLAPLLDQWKIDHRIVDLHLGEVFPAVGAKDAVVVLGGPDSANDQTSKIIGEIVAIQKYLDQGTPFLGVCLGLQLLVKARGGKVLKNPVKEIGFKAPDQDWFRVRKTVAGKKDPLLQGLSDAFRIFQLHGETVEPIGGMECLGESTFCKNQIVKVQEKVYGIQGHVELSERMFEDWLREDGDLNRMDPQLLRKEFHEVRQELESNCKILFSNFLRIAGML